MKIEICITQIYHFERTRRTFHLPRIHSLKIFTQFIKMFWDFYQKNMRHVHFPVWQKTQKSRKINFQHIECDFFSFLCSFLFTWLLRKQNLKMYGKIYALCYCLFTNIFVAMPHKHSINSILKSLWCEERNETERYISRKIMCRQKKRCVSYQIFAHRWLLLSALLFGLLSFQDKHLDHKANRTW